MKNFGKYKIQYSFILSLFASPLVFSQENNELLEAITTQDVALDGTSYRSEDVKNNPGSRSIISQRQLTQTGQKSVDSALQSIPGIQIRDYSGTGVLPKLQFRGFGGAGNGHSNTGLILLDGNNIYGAPYSNIELALFPISFLAIDHIDYIKGGASVQYGPNTFSGVLNISSKPISKEWENIIAERITIWDRARFSYQESGDYSYNALYDTYVKTGGMINEHFGLDLQANILSGQSFRENTPNKVQNFMARAVYNINENHKLNAFYQYYNYLSKDAGTLSTADYLINPFANKRPNNLASGLANRAGLNYKYFFSNQGNLDGNLSVNYYYQGSSRDFRIDNNFNTINYNTPATTITDNVRRFNVHVLEPKVDINLATGFISQNIILGTRYTFESVLQDAFVKNIATSAVTRNQGNTFSNHYLAFYLSDEIKFLDVVSINPGIRYEFIDASFSGSPEPKIQHQFNPALSISYKPISSLILYANYQRSFLPPQTTGDIAGTNFFRTTTFQNAEAGIRYFLNSKLSVNATYFSIFADKYRIGRFVTDPNGANILSQGLELELYLSPIRGLDIHISYTFTDARIRDHQLSSSNQDLFGKFLPFVSPHSFNFDVIYDIPKIFTLGFSGFYYSKSFSDIENTILESSDGRRGIQPDYFVFNAQISRALWKKDKQKIEASIALNNIFNAQYYFRGIGTSPAGRMSAPGRSVTFFISYTF